MGMQYSAFGGNVLGKATAALDNVFYAVVPGARSKFTRVAGFSLTAGNTANAGYWLRPIGRANIATAIVADAGAVAVLDADPSPSGNTIAAGDQVVIECTDGVYRRYQVNTAGWNGTSKTVTFTANVANAVAAGNKVFNFGIFTDTDPVLGVAHPSFPSVLNTQRIYTFGPAGICGHQAGDPLLFYCPNATNATVLDYAEYTRTRE